MNPRNTDIVARYEAGEKLEAIAALYGVSRQRIEQLARRYGCEKRPKVVKPKPAPRIGRLGHVDHADRNAAIIRRRMAGESCAAIGKDIGMSRGGVGRVVAVYGPNFAEKPA